MIQRPLVDDWQWTLALNVVVGSLFGTIRIELTGLVAIDWSSDGVDCGLTHMVVASIAEAAAAAAVLSWRVIVEVRRLAGKCKTPCSMPGNA